MSISDKLADLNYQRYKDFTETHDKKNARPAMYAFAGDVYTGLDAYTIEEEKIDAVNNRLRILSGMYGILKPLDLIQPYRLEMGTKLPVRYIVDKDCKTLEDVKGFDYIGYRFSEEHTEKAQEPVFIR